MLLFTKRKQLNKCAPFLLSSSLPPSPAPSFLPASLSLSLPPPPPACHATSGICLSEAQLSRACEVEMSGSVSQIRMRLLGC